MKNCQENPITQRLVSATVNFLVPSGVILGALAYLAWKSLSASVADVDFKYLWFAGSLWAEGTSPYGHIYYERAKAFFDNTNIPWLMAYPPNWYPIARATAVLPLDVAERLWGALSAIMLLASSALIARTVCSVRERDDIWPFVAFGTFICMGSATAIALSLGQTAPLMAVGLALFLRGFIARSQLALAAALVILIVKPNFGLPFVAFLFVWRSSWPAVFGAVAVSLIAASMALLPYGPLAVLEAYVEGLGNYGGDPVNKPPSLTGLVNIVYNGLGLNLGGFIPVGLAILTAVALAFWLKTVEAKNRSSDRMRLAAVLALVACVLFLTPLHTYDLLLAAPLLLLPALSRFKWDLVTVGSLVSFFIMFRVSNLANFTGLTFPAETYFAGSALASAALLMLLLVSLLHFWTVKPGIGITSNPRVQ